MATATRLTAPGASAPGSDADVPGPSGGAAGVSDGAGWGFPVACGDGGGCAVGEDGGGWAVGEDRADGWTVGARVRYTRYPAPSDTTSARTETRLFFTIECVPCNTE